MNIPIENLQVRTLNVGLCDHDADWNWKDVISPFSRLYLVTRGNAKIALPDGIHELNEGYLYFIPAHTKHSCMCNSRFTHYYIHIFEDVKVGVSLLDSLSFPVRVKATDYDHKLFARICELNPFLRIPSSNPHSYDNHQMIIDNQKKLMSRPLWERMETRGISYQLLSRFIKDAEYKMFPKDERILEAITTIYDNMDKALSIDQLAEKACMSKGHFFRVFKEETGETPNIFITKLKIMTAERMLVTSDRQIKRIADDLGFDDYSYFTRLFKKYAGITPQQYREQNFTQAD